MATNATCMRADSMRRAFEPQPRTSFWALSKLHICYIKYDSQIKANINCSRHGRALDNLYLQRITEGAYNFIKKYKKIKDIPIKPS